MRRLLVLLVLALAFTLVLVPAASAQPNSPLRCELFMELNWDFVLTGIGPSWFGTISGDIEGSVTLWFIGATFPGITEHYAEMWIIETDEETIVAYQEGVWSFKSFEFKSNGWVTDATGAWEYLVGSDMHVRGVTTPVLDPSIPVYGTGILWFCGFGPE